MVAAGTGGRTVTTVLRHRGGNQQVVLSDGQRWHLPRGKSPRDIPPQDKMGEQLQAAVNTAVQQWGPSELSGNERGAIQEALKKQQYWLARLLEGEARGRFVERMVKSQFKGLLEWSVQGVDAVDPATGLKYEILSGTESNLARHGRRMADELFRMLFF